MSEHDEAITAVLDILESYTGTAQREDWPQDRLLEMITEDVRALLSNETTSA